MKLQTGTVGNKPESRRSCEPYMKQADYYYLTSGRRLIESSNDLKTPRAEDGIELTAICQEYSERIRQMHSEYQSALRAISSAELGRLPHLHTTVCCSDRTKILG